MSQSNDDESDFMTVGEIAKRYRVSKMTIYRLIQNGEVPATKIGQSLRVHRDAVEQIPRNAANDAPRRAACE